MKYLNKYLLVLTAAILIATGCASGSEGEQVPAPTPEDGAAAEADPSATPAVEETEVAVDEPTATAEPIELTEEDMIAAALAAFDANPEPETLIAWDHLDARVSGTEVILTMCTWTGDTVFDEVRAANYIVTPGDDGNPKTRFNFSNGLFGQECLNTALIESALAFTREYDEHWQAVLNDPTSFDLEEAALFKTADVLAANTEGVEGWNRDDLHWEGDLLDGELPDSAIRDILGRRFLFQEQEFFELIACRQMNERFGLYQNTTLIDDSRGDSVHKNSVVRYQLRRDAGGWLLAGSFTDVWADCISQPSWLDRINDQLPEPAPWQTVVSHE